MATFADQALRVLDLSQELDVALLDQIVTHLYSSVGPEVPHIDVYSHRMHYSSKFVVAESAEIFEGQLTVYRDYSGRKVSSLYSSYYMYVQ